MGMLAAVGCLGGWAGRWARRCLMAAGHLLDVFSSRTHRTFTKFTVLSCPSVHATRDRPGLFQPKGANHLFVRSVAESPHRAAISRCTLLAACMHLHSKLQVRSCTCVASQRQQKRSKLFSTVCPIDLPIASEMRLARGPPPSLRPTARNKFA